MSSTKSKSPEHGNKDRKYDRQLRLWGHQGQSSLEKCKVCLINASVTGSEILKSLVLPGIGSFTIVDDRPVIEKDLTENFFLTKEYIGQSRAYAAMRNLEELNPDVKGDFIEESVDSLLKNNPKFFDDFSVVVATEIPKKTLISLSKILFDFKVPLVYCKSVGFIGYIRLQFNKHTIIQKHDDNEPPDFRLDQPFDELKAYMATYNLADMTEPELNHVPYLVLLYKAVEKFVDETKRYPCERNDKDKLKLYLNSFKERFATTTETSANFKEAFSMLNVICRVTSIPANVQAVFDDDECTYLNKHSSKFWILAKALKDFVEKNDHNSLPVKGYIPDMTSDTKSYTSLQKIYYDKAMSDKDKVYGCVEMSSIEPEFPSDNAVTESDVRYFCRYAADLTVVHGSSIAAEYEKYFTNNLAKKLENIENPLVYYLLLRAIDDYYDEYYSYPGHILDQLESDIAKIKDNLMKKCAEFGNVKLMPKDDFIHEVCRYGGAELYSVSSFVASCAAHECIKLITNQYGVLNNTLIYDGIRNQTESIFM